jgi:hypothetical protein
MVNESETESRDREARGVGFVHLIWTLAQSAAIQLGDAEDPATGQPLTPNLPAAQQMIDLVAVLEEKTRGNLTAEERQLLEQLLFELRMRYVEVEKAGAEPSPQSRIIIP